MRRAIALIAAMRLKTVLSPKRQASAPDSFRFEADLAASRAPTFGTTMKKSTKIVAWTTTALACVALVWYAAYRSGANNEPEGIHSSNGRLEGATLKVATLHAGTVSDVFAKEGDMVELDQPLATIESVANDRTKTVAEQTVKRLRAQADQAQAAVESAKQQEKLAKIERDAAAKLYAQKLISDVEMSKQNVKLDYAKTAAAQAAAAAAAGKAAAEEAEAQVQALNGVTDDLTLKSPATGSVEHRLADKGELVAQGGLIFTVLKSGDYSLDAFYPGKISGALQKGAEARIRIEGLGDYVFPAFIERVDKKSEFTPKFVETKEESEKLMFRVKIKIPLDVGQKYESLMKPGTPAVAYVSTRPDGSFPSDLAPKLPPEPRRLDSAPTPAPDATPAPGAHDAAQGTDGGQGGSAANPDAAGAANDAVVEGGSETK